VVQGGLVAGGSRTRGPLSKGRARGSRRTAFPCRGARVQRAGGHSSPGPRPDPRPATRHKLALVALGTPPDPRPAGRRSLGSSRGRTTEGPESSPVVFALAPGGSRRGAVPSVRPKVRPTGCRRDRGAVAPVPAGAPSVVSVGTDLRRSAPLKLRAGPAVVPPHGRPLGRRPPPRGRRPAARVPQRRPPAAGGIPPTGSQSSPRLPPSRWLPTRPPTVFPSPSPS